jgi:hypothetical protein
MSMTWVHLVRGTYIAVSLVVAVFAQWRPGIHTRPERLAGAAFAAYAIATAAAQVYAFNHRLTFGTAYIGFGVVAGLIWLASLAATRRPR